MLRLKYLDLGLLIYAADHDDRLPEASAWMDSIGRSNVPKESFRCPAFEGKDGSEYGYAMNLALDHKNTEKLAAPESVPLVFDSSLLGRNASSSLASLPNPPRHRKNCIAYLDGHVGVYDGRGPK